MRERVKSALMKIEEAFAGDRCRAGFNKTVKLVKRGEAEAVYLASDADEDIASQIRAVCRAAGITPDERFDKKTLGKRCGIRVGCAAAAILK